MCNKFDTFAFAYSIYKFTSCSVYSNTCVYQKYFYISVFIYFVYKYFIYIVCHAFCRDNIDP